jgi:hypothetical protein
MAMAAAHLVVILTTMMIALLHAAMAFWTLMKPVMEIAPRAATTPTLAPRMEVLATLRHAAWFAPTSRS